MIPVPPTTGVHTHYQYAHTRLRVHRAPGIPRALWLMRAKMSGNSQALRVAECGRMFNVARALTPLSTVIVRLDRTIQYSVTSAMQRIDRDVLDAAPSQGMTAVCGASSPETEDAHPASWPSPPE